MSTDSSIPAPQSPENGNPRRSHRKTDWVSVLFEDVRDCETHGSEQPDFFGDLNLDQVLGAMTIGRERYSLEPFFAVALHDPGAVQYRHEVLCDLERPQVLDAIKKFAELMDRVREHLRHAEKLSHRLQQESWFVDAAEIYCDAARRLAGEMVSAGVSSRALGRMCDYLHSYVGSESFTALERETSAVKERIAGLRYRLRIHGPRVTVSRDEAEEDYSIGVLQTFAKFRQAAANGYLVALSSHAEMNHIEAQILEGVAELHPEQFAARAAYCAHHREFLDATIVRFNREVQFYVAYLELIAPLRSSGLAFCCPQVSADAKDEGVRDAFDLGLAIKTTPENREVVCNDLSLQGSERVFVVSGPNNGGKTTFARMFGQLHHLAALGLPVPGREARLFLPDRIFTHFEREETIETLHGKFDEELMRVREILGQATSQSLIVMNESFSSTTLNDALFVGTEVMRQILERGCLGVYVTFVEEIASLSDATVSLVAEVVADNPAQRTFKVLRRPADGLAYAHAIAEKHGVTFERLMERIEG